MSKFNKIYQQIIFESSQADLIKDEIQDMVLTNNQFYNNYLSNLSIKSGVVVVKARFDTFRVYGVMKNIIKFFKDFKVTNNYFSNQVAGVVNDIYDPMGSSDKDKPADFVIYAPLVSVVDNSFFYHQMNDPGNEKYFTVGNYIPTREDLINILHREAISRWNTVKVVRKEDNLEYDVKEAKPAEFAKVLEDVYDPNVIGIVEFKINSSHLPNYVWEQDSFYWSGDEAVESVLKDQRENPITKCKIPEIKDKEYQNKSLAEKSHNYNPTNKVSVKTLKMKTK